MYCIWVILTSTNPAIEQPIYITLATTKRPKILKGLSSEWEAIYFYKCGGNAHRSSTAQNMCRVMKQKYFACRNVLFKTVGLVCATTNKCTLYFFCLSFLERVFAT